MGTEARLQGLETSLVYKVVCRVATSETYLKNQEEKGLVGHVVEV